jgi:hypothetical protein
MSSLPRTCTIVEAPPNRRYACLCAAIAERPDNSPYGFEALEHSRDRALQAAAATRRLWAPGREIRVQFLGGSARSRRIAEQALTAWEPHVNLRFKGVSRSGEIRVTFDPRLGSWSHLGTDALAVPSVLATLNLGWDDPATAMHEFGHALGYIHEHQNPDGGIRWDVEAVYRYYEGPPNHWDRQTTKANVLDVYDARTLTNGGFDPKSIMLYPIPRELVLDPKQVTGWNRTLSPGDLALARRLYPRTPNPAADLGREALDRLLRRSPDA